VLRYLEPRLSQERGPGVISKLTDLTSWIASFVGVPFPGDIGSRAGITRVRASVDFCSQITLRLLTQDVRQHCFVWRGGSSCRELVVAQFDADGVQQAPARPHDSGSQANETVDGLDAATEDLRHAAEDTPSGIGRDKRQKSE
jgi:hypothetical protein